MTDLGQLLHALLHDVSPWDKDGWRVRQGSSCLHVVSLDDGFNTGCISFDGRPNAAFIAAAPATVGRLIKGMVETEAHNRPITKNIEIAFGVWNRLHAFDTEGALHAFGISASDWKLLLERLGDG